VTRFSWRFQGRSKCVSLFSCGYSTYIRKVVVVGPVRSGKTSIIDRVCDHTFTDVYKPTSGREHVRSPSFTGDFRMFTVCTMV
jgi:GTPase SAR1 family protein